MKFIRTHGPPSLYGRRYAPRVHAGRDDREGTNHRSALLAEVQGVDRAAPCSIPSSISSSESSSSSSAKHSELAQAFLRVVIDLCTKARLGPAQRALMAVVIRAGERPRLALRSDLVRQLEAADMHAQAAEVRRVRVADHQALTWIESDEATGALVVPVAKPPDGVMRCDLPTDDVIRALIGDVR